MHLGHCNSWDWSNLSSLLKVFGITQFVKLFEEFFEFVTNKLVGESISLEVFPYFCDSLNEVIRVVSFDDIINFGLNLLIDILLNILSNFMVDISSILNCRFLCSDGKIKNKTKII
jgi:hypothetical protein